MLSSRWRCRTDYCLLVLKVSVVELEVGVDPEFSVKSGPGEPVILWDSGDLMGPVQWALSRELTLLASRFSFGLG